MEKPERPSPDADASKIQEWMEEDFWREVAEGINVGADKDDEDESGVVEVEIINHERGEVVGIIDTDGNLDTESDALRNVSQKYLD